MMQTQPCQTPLCYNTVSGEAVPPGGRGIGEGTGRRVLR